MPTPSPRSSSGREALRTPVSGDVDYPQGRCRACGRLLTGRQRETCAPRCRVAWCRRQQARTRADALARHVAALDALRADLEAERMRWEGAAASRPRHR